MYCESAMFLPDEEDHFLSWLSVLIQSIGDREFNCELVSPIPEYPVDKLGAHGDRGHLARKLGKKLAQFRRGFELRHGIELLEGAGKRVRQAPTCQ